MEHSLFDFSDAEIMAAAQDKRLLSLELEFTRACNYKCPYCYVGEVNELPEELTSEEIDSVIRQAAALGARKIVILGGEPLLYERLEEKLQLIDSLGMRPEIFTNSSLVDEAVAQMLYRYRARVVVKFNSLNAEVQNYLTGEPDALNKVFAALENLYHAGYDQTPGLLAASTVICSCNLSGIVDLWKYLRAKQIIPYFEMLTPQGRLNDNPQLMVDPLEIQKVFEEISEYDRLQGFNWEVQPPLVGGKCLRHLYSCVVSASGEVLPCVGVDSSAGNIRERNLSDILSSSAMFHDFKHFRSRIKEPCRSCESAGQCYGCRGAAYQITGDYLAADPMCWKNADKLDQISSLPLDCAGLLPHRKPILMVDSIIKLGDRSRVSVLITPDNQFLDANGKISCVIAPELAAQAAAAIDTVRGDFVTRSGMLAGADKIVCNGDIGVGDRLEVEICEQATMGEWSIIGFWIFKNGQTNPVIQGELKLCIVDM